MSGQFCAFGIVFSHIKTEICCGVEKECGGGQNFSRSFFLCCFFFFRFSSELMCNVSFKDFIYSDKQVRNVLWNHQKAPQTEGGASVSVFCSLLTFTSKNRRTCSPCLFKEQPGTETEDDNQSHDNISFTYVYLCCEP